MSSIKHIGIIMDGNGRWAQLRGRPRTFGHIKGARVAKKIITRGVEMGLENLTLYAFSTENWLRPKSEVSFLMGLLKRYLERELQTLIQKNIRFSTIGSLENLPRDVRLIVHRATVLTQTNTGMNLVFALSYGSRQEITEAARELCQKVRDGSLQPEEVTEALFESHLQSYPLPSPDLIIRTSGEKRLSNFLLWQSAYSELFFTDTLWPDFSLTELHEIINNYALRERRFGSIKSEIQNPTY